MRYRVPVLLALLLLADAPLAGSAPEAIVRQSFTPAEFARFAPRTALDMARQVPGFPLDDPDEDEQSRGFGQANTNVLINGRRVSGKSNGPVAALARIPVNNVLRLEIVDGASLDIPGLSGQVLNVITQGGGRISGQYRYSPLYRTDRVPFQDRDFSIALSGGGTASEWTLNLTNDMQYRGSSGPEFVTDGTGVLVDRRAEQILDLTDIPSLNGAYTRTTQRGSVVNLTGEVYWSFADFEEISQRNPIDATASVRFLDETEDEFGFELGADYEFGLGIGRLKLIGLHSFADFPSEARVTFDFADGRPQSGTLFERESEQAESLVRAEYTHPGLGGDWQWALEGAHNYLDIESALSVRDDTGALVPVALPGASSRVEEDRAEINVSYSRALSEKLQLQMSIGAEYSELSQLGEFGQVRSFVRPKGFISLNWRASDASNLSLQLERRVGQLDFADFVASVNVNQNQVDVTNTNLVPPQSWLINLQLQQSLHAYGSLTLSGFYERVSDIVDRIPIEGGGQAPGNIDSATRWGATTSMTLLSDPLGWRGARMDLDASYTDSDVLDPLLGSSRRISDDDYVSYEINLRQDFPNSPWAIGLEIAYNESTPLVRLDQVTLFQPSTIFTRGFVEHKDFFGLTVRGSVGNLTDRSNDFFRTIYNDRAVNDVRAREERFLDFGLLIGLEVEGSF